MQDQAEKERSAMKKAGVKVDEKPTDIKPGRVVYRPTQGYAWNPLREWPRNEVCFCGSKKKAKKCHLNEMAPCILESDAVKLQKYLDDYKSGKPVMPLKFE